jgi:hypothetical protein
MVEGAYDNDDTSSRSVVDIRASGSTSPACNHSLLNDLAAEHRQDHPPSDDPASDHATKDAARHPEHHDAADVDDAPRHADHHRRRSVRRSNRLADRWFRSHRPDLRNDAAGLGGTAGSACGGRSPRVDRKLDTDRLCRRWVVVDQRAFVDRRHRNVGDDRRLRSQRSPVGVRPPVADSLWTDGDLGDIFDDPRNHHHDRRDDNDGDDVTRVER